MALYGLEDNELSMLKSGISSVKGVEKAIVYGSRAKGCNKPFSDIDISLV